MKRVLLIIALTLLCALQATAQTTTPPTGSTTPPPAAAADASPAASDTPAPNTKPAASASPAASTLPAANASPNAKPGASSSPAQSTGKLPGAKNAAVVLPPEKASPVSMARFDKAPVIDGKLDEDVWKHAVVLKDFYQIDPGDNTTPSKQTQVLLGYDAKTLYIAFVATDEPDKVRATVPRRDQIFQDDYVGFFMDTFNDKRRAYCIFFSPLGVQADGILTEGRGEDYSVDIVMESKGQVTADGFTVEVAIPFKSLRYEAGKGKLWGAHFFRRIKRFNNELDSWMPFSRDVRGNLNQAGHLTGLENISTERTLEIIPSLTVSETGKRLRSIPRSILQRSPGLVDPGRMVNQPIELDPGLTAKFGITPQMTLDLALNPDFAQVEADQLVVTANQRFPIFFPERRPFFLEGIDIFQTRITAVHTRAIVDPDVAVKLSGKQGRNTFGLMFASDNAPGNFSKEERTDPSVLPGIERFLDKNAYIGVLRLKRDIGKENSLGLIATTYNFIEKHNNVGGFDGRFKWAQKYLAEFQVLGTTSRRFFFDPNRDDCIADPAQRATAFGRRCNTYRTGNALAYSFVTNRSTRNWFIELSGAGRTRDYRADVGFVQRTNINTDGFFFGYFSTPKEKAKHLVSWYAQTYSHIDYDWQGHMQIWESEYHIGGNGHKQSWFDIGYERAYERLFEEEFGRKRTPQRLGIFFGDSAERSTGKNHFFISGGATPSKKYSFDGYMNYRQGHFDLDFGAGSKYPRVSPAALAFGQDAQLDPGPGGLIEMGASFAYQPSSALRTTLNYTKNRLRRYDTDRVAFDENILSSRTTYQFTKFIFARARVDYSTLQANVKGQFLFGYTPNPGTALYLGYNDDLNRNGFNPFSGNLEPGFRRNGRTFFIKASYLIRRSF